MTTWRAFIGEPGHRADTHQVGLTWQLARDVLRDFAAESIEVTEGHCEFCHAQAVDSLAALDQLPADTAWRGDIDWDELILEPDTNPDPMTPPARYPPGVAWSDEYSGWMTIGSTDDTVPRIDDVAQVAGDERVS